MKRIFFFSFFLLVTILPMWSQDGEWLAVPDVATGVSVEMPGLPVFEKKSIFLDEQVVEKDIFAFYEDRFELGFESHVTDVEGKKPVNKLIAKSIDLAALAHEGQPNKVQTLYREGVDYRYVEFSLLSGRMVRSVFFVHAGKLFHVYVKGRRSYVFGIDANYYLGSWKLGVKPEPETPGQTDSSFDIDPEDKPITPADVVDAVNYPDTWSKVVVYEDVSLSFPGNPFTKTTVVDFGSRKVIVDAYARYSPEHRLSYVLTRRNYSPDEGQLNNEALYAYVVDRILGINKLKVIDESNVNKNGFQAKEYVLSKGLKHYRLQLFRVGDSIYQCLVKGRRKSIHSAASERFFGNIKILN